MAAKSNPRRWTREESIIVFNLYLRIPFKDSNKSHPDVLHFATLVDRTPDAVNMKIGNFGSLDPDLQKRGIKGLRNASRLDQAVWNEYHDDWQKLIEESEQLISERESAIGISPQHHKDALPDGTEAMTVRRIRINQQFFRKAILSAYESKCCVTGIDIRTITRCKSYKAVGPIRPNREVKPAKRIVPECVA